MAEHHNMRRPPDSRRIDRSASSGRTGQSTRSSRSSLFYAPGESNNLERHSRAATRYSSTERRTAGRHSGNGSSNQVLPASVSVKPAHVRLLAGLLFLLVCAFVLLGFVLSSNSGSESTRQPADAIKAADTVEKVATGVGAAVPGASSTTGKFTGSVKDINPSAMLSIPGSKSVESIIVGKDAASSEACAFNTGEIEMAISAIEEYGDCGFVFLDMNTGRGLAYNADEEMYIASAAKVVLAHFALQNGAAENEDERYNMEEAIKYSENEAYEGFGYNYSGNGYGEWLNAHDVWFDDYVFDLYPPMSARSLASFWVEILKYVSGESEDAQWFAELLSSTEMSFIRDGVSETGALVMNKGGWIGEEGYASVTDAGIIELNGHTYLMVIITGQFDDEGITEVNVTNLANALFAVRNQL